MIQYSLRRLLVSMSLVGIGVAIGAWVLAGHGPANDWIAGALLLGGAAMFGAGLFAPFKLPIWGALIGVLIGAAFVALTIVTNYAMNMH